MFLSFQFLGIPIGGKKKPKPTKRMELPSPLLFKACIFKQEYMYDFQDNTQSTCEITPQSNRQHSAIDGSTPNTFNMTQVFRKSRGTGSLYNT